MCRLLHRFVAAGIAALALPAPGLADVTPDQRVKILVAALGFNRSLASSDALEIVVGVVGDCPTLQALQQADGKKISGKPLRVVVAAETSYAYMDRSGINVLYFCQIGEAEAKTVGKAAGRLGATVLADDPALVATAAMMGVREVEGRPKLMLNMKLAKAANLEFDPRIMGAAEIVAE